MHGDCLLINSILTRDRCSLGTSGPEQWRNRPSGGGTGRAVPEKAERRRKRPSGAGRSRAAQGEGDESHFR